MKQSTNHPNPVSIGHGRAQRAQLQSIRHAVTAPAGRGGFCGGKIALAALALVVLVLPFPAQAAPEGAVPEIWNQIAPQIERAAYEFQGGSGTATARNRAQDFALAADKAGLAVDGALRLKAAALNGEALPDAEPTVSGARVEYRRGAVVEWFENCAEGLEQGFTIDQQPPTNEQLSLAVMFETELGVEVAEDGQAVLLTDEEGAVKYRYGKLHVFDAAGRTLDSCFASPATWNRKPATKSLLIVADSRNATWPITIDPVLTSMAKKLLAPDGAADDFFGFAVAVAGDVAVVGVPYDELMAGSVYLFERGANGTNAWGLVKKLVASDGAADDVFGESVAVAGDMVAVGARGDNAAQGSVYVFERNVGGTNNWGQAKKLLASDGDVGDRFGVSVAADGDVIVVGADRYDFGATDTGAAYVFERNADGTNAWGQVQLVQDQSGLDNRNFGSSVAVAGDVVVVGSPSADGAAVNAGAVYLYERNARDRTNAWTRVRTITAADGGTGDHFGCSVAAAGDVVAVGAYLQASMRGAAYVYERNAGNTNAWNQVKKLVASDGAAADFFGISVAAAGDVIVVGADGEDPSRNAAYVFERNAGGTNQWGQLQKLQAAAGAADDGFGSSVAAGDDLILVGAPQDDDLGSAAGAAFVFPLGTEDWNAVKKITDTIGGGWTGGAFGISVAAAGDVVVAGATGTDILGENSGSAYVFERNAGGTNAWGPLPLILTSQNPQGMDDYFGVSVAADGDVIVVGADGDEAGGASAGAAYVFERNANGTNRWGWLKKLTASDASAGDHFGESVDVDGDVIVAGAAWKDNATPDQGRAYVFERNAHKTTNGWGQVKELASSDISGSDSFGEAVAVDGDVIVVGAIGDDDQGDSAGAAYVFERNEQGSNNWGQVAKLLARDGEASAQFGNSVAVAGDVILVGAPGDDAVAANAGAAYIFERNGRGTNRWGQIKKLVAGDAAAGDGFGVSVAVAGDVILVGADGDDDAGSTSGSAYVFGRNAGGTNRWEQVEKLAAPDGASFDAFGFAVAAAGDVLVAGAFGDDDLADGAGAAYVYEGSLFGPPTITNVAHAAGTTYVSFPSQPAWSYTLQCRTDMVAGAWAPCMAFYVPGEVDGSTTFDYLLSQPHVFFSVIRKAP